MPTDISIFTASFGVFAAFIVGGFVLLFSELRRLEGTLDNGLVEARREWRDQRAEMQQEFRAQRAEVLAQTTALANALVAARGGDR
jgi:hypothetical protein